MGENVIESNRDVNFEIEKCELVIIFGTSGAGKSTLLNVLVGMDVFDEGKSLSMAPTLQDLMSENERTTEETTLLLSFSSIIWLPI
ncbi:ABC superfamily ATP binding cassette transporter, ABC protein [Ligilactobacillus ruminis]|nr:ABC superfamily ATP binding cassette transporter, ABC protein [Ligilactobacillus ruminis]